MGKPGKTKVETPSLFEVGSVLYDERFLEAHAGSRILHDPKTAIVELIANAWDAGATSVCITWPDGERVRQFAIEDNGGGMTNAEFQKRWRKLNYDRQKEMGPKVTFPPDLAAGRPDRFAFGRNGIGRWSGFCFGKEYSVDTCKDGLRNRYTVARGIDQPFDIRRTLSNKKTSKGHGTVIRCDVCRRITLSADDARSEIGMRFLTDPDFQVKLNGQSISFEHIDDPNVTTETLTLGSGHKVQLITIDTQATDRTTKQHGVAWHVGKRLVGDCSWKGVGGEDVVDGRRIAAKRFTFIVKADHLADAKAIKKDWSGFEADNERYLEAAQAVYDKVRERLLAASEADRNQTLSKARDKNQEVLETIGPLAVEKWELFVNEAQQACPRVRESDIVKLSEVLANLEQAKSGYALLHKLSEYGPDQLDELHQLLDDWTLDMAKVVLDEIGRRLLLVDELGERTKDDSTLEVQELQPLFERGLWIFGPEFETIEYTANEGMTTVVQELFGQKHMTGSRNRPDFAILPDSTVGLYALPEYDETGGEVGADKLVVVELKKPGVPVGEDQKTQCWKYVKELYAKGLLGGRSDVRCFVLGKTIAANENARRTEKDEQVIIQPLTFSWALERAKGRLLKLYDRIKTAPLVQRHHAEIAAFLKPADGGKAPLFDGQLKKRVRKRRETRALDSPTSLITPGAPE
jgi:hypothetical protein